MGHYSVRGGILELSEDLRCAAWPTGCGYSGIDPIKQEFREAFRAERAGRRNGEGDVVSLVQPQIVLQRGPSSSRIIFAQSGNSNRESRSMRLLQLLRTRRYNSRAHRSGTKQHNSWSLKVGFSDSQRRAQGVHKSRRQRRAVVSRRRATGRRERKQTKNGCGAIEAGEKAGHTRCRRTWYHQELQSLHDGAFVSSKYPDAFFRG